MVWKAETWRSAQHPGTCSQPESCMQNINQFQRLMRGHGAAKMGHTYTLVWHSTATLSTFILRRVCYARLLTSTIFLYSSLSRSEYRY